MKSFVEELKRRHVVRVGVTYLIVAWLILQLTDLVVQDLTLDIVIFYLIRLEFLEEPLVCADKSRQQGSSQELANLV